MRNHMLEALLGGVRLVLVVAALVVAMVPIGRAAISGFCPTPDDAATVVVALPVAGPLATIVEPTAEPTVDPTADPTAEPTPAPTEGVTEEAADCPGGVDRCLPPLLSAVLTFGDGDCGDEAVAMLRTSMLPAFAIASVMLAAAWALRPRHGEPIVSRQ